MKLLSGSTKRYILLIAGIILSILSTAQTKLCFGKIIDKKSSELLPFVSIQLKNTGIGTISDKTGNFSLKIPNKYSNGKIILSHLGYETLEIQIEEVQRNHKIELKPIDYEIGEVIIMPDSTLLTLLKRAYKKIPVNYPDYPTKLKGFYRESIKAANNDYLYFAEAVIETYKSNYNLSSDNGQVKILKSLVNEFPGLDKLKARFYGGIFVNEDDFVKKREDFISPQHFDNYSYKLFSITKYQNEEVYVISFDTKNDSLNGTKKGKFYIEKTSLAYVGCEYEETNRGLRNYNIKSPGIKSKEGTAKVVYEKYNGRWHLKYTVYSMLFQENDHYPYEINSEFITTEIYTDSVKPIPFGERMEFGEVFSEKAKNYQSDSYWEEYNILKKDSSLEKQLKILYDTVESKKILTQKAGHTKKFNWISILSKLSSGFGLGYLPIYSDKATYSINYINDNTINLTEELNSFRYNINFLTQINYYLNYRWSLNGAIQKSLNNKIYTRIFDIGASYRILLNKKTKPVVLSLSLLYSFNKYSRNFSTYQNNTNFEFGNKSFDAKKLQFGIGTKTGGLKPKISLEYNFRNIYWIYVSAGYYLPLYSNEVLFLREKSGFFIIRKKANIGLSDNSLNVNYNEIPTNKSHINFDNYNLCFGFMIKI